MKTYQWSQVKGAASIITDGSTATAKVTLAGVTAYKNEPVKNLKLLNRTVVQPINPGALASAQTATFKSTVTTSNSTYSGTVDVSVIMPFNVASGLADVPINLAILVHGKTASSYSWALSTKPSSSTAALSDATTQDPYFTPDIAGKYTLREATTAASLDIFAGTWTGALRGSDAKNQPLSASCTVCHNNSLAQDNFATRKTTGHARVFTRAITNTADHCAETCLSCHSVGYEALGAKNNGINDQPDFTALQAIGMLTHPAVDAWSTIFSKFPKTAALTNIQCENCHGPNGADSALHPNANLPKSGPEFAWQPARGSLSSDVCGVCHGGPPGYSLFQQGQTSPHSNFDTASAEGTNASCVRCHTA